MPQTCSVCKHPQRSEIETALLNHETLRKIAEEFSVSQTALHRHKKDHIPAALMRADDAKEIVRADNLLAQVHSLLEKTLELLAQAEREGDLRTALMATREIRGSLELLAKMVLAGEMSGRQREKSSSIEQLLQSL